MVGIVNDKSLYLDTNLWNSLLHQKVNPQRIVGELSIPAVKYAMDYNGMYGGNPRLPLLPLTADKKAEVEQLLENIRN